jgi:serine/threonine protein kinase
MLPQTGAMIWRPSAGLPNGCHAPENPGLFSALPVTLVGSNSALSLINQLVGNYRIVRLLGEGGMGAVYLAVHTSIGRKVAIKVLRREVGEDPLLTERFFNEARAANAVGHPGIIDIIDLGTWPMVGPFLIMEFLEGESLAARLQRVGFMPVAEAVDIVNQTAAAIGAAHAKGIIHRDLKPANLFLVPSGTPNRPDKVKVLDFGVAKLSGHLAGDMVKTLSGAVVGTPAYMSPEQCLGIQHEVDHCSDIYSLGCILFELLCGQRPFGLSSQIGVRDMMLRHVAHMPTPPRTLVPDLPEHLEYTVMRAMAKRPEHRFRSMAELQHALLGGDPDNFLEEYAHPPPAGRPTQHLPNANEYEVGGSAFAADAPYGAPRTPSAPRTPPGRGKGAMMPPYTPSGPGLPETQAQSARGGIGRWAVLVAVALAGTGGVLLYSVGFKPRSEVVTPTPAKPGPDNEQQPWGYIDAAEQLVMGKQYEAAQDLVNKAGQLQTTSPELKQRVARLRDTLATAKLINEGEQRLAGGRWREALDSARAALALDPENPEALALRVSARRGQQSLELAARGSIKSRVRKPAGRGKRSSDGGSLAMEGKDEPASRADVTRPTADPGDSHGGAGSMAKASAPEPPVAPPRPAPVAARQAGPTAGADGSAFRVANATGQPAAGAAAAQRGPIYSVTPHADIGKPTLPRSAVVRDAEQLREICGRVESSVISLAGVSPEFARGITGSLRRRVTAGSEVYPVAMYYFIIREAALKHERAGAAEALAAAHSNHQILILRDLPANAP